MQSPEIIVIGAGPAGAMSACLLARAGVRVLLSDRAAFPRPKLCGGCLAQSGYDLLRANQLHTLPSLADARVVDRLRVHSASRVLELRVPAYRVIDRSRFDHDLVHAAINAGTRFCPGTQARVRTDHSVQLTDPNGAQRVLTPKSIIIADGIKGTSLRDLDRFAWHTRPNGYIGMGAIASALPRGCDPNAISMHHFHSGYAGLAPLPGGRAVIAAAVDPDWVKGQHDGTPLAGLLCELKIDIDPNTRLHTNPGAPGLTRRRAAIEADRRIFLIGDATGYIEPFTGEGMTWALADACMMTHHALAVLGGRYTAGAWTAQHRSINRRRKVLCRGTARLLRAPRLTRALIRTASGSRMLTSGLGSAVRTLQRQNLPHGSVA